MAALTVFDPLAFVWFSGPLELALTATGILIVLWRQQFASKARRAFDLQIADNGKAKPKRATPSPSKRR